MQRRTYLRSVLPQIEAAARAGDDKLVVTLWVGAFANAPEEDPEMSVLARERDFAHIWAAMVLALREMRQEERQERLRSRQTRYWLRRLALEATDVFGPATPIWMEWRVVSREMAEVEDGRGAVVH
jgi:hypothetical protein